MSKELGINPKALAKWRKRATVEDMKTGPTEPRSTVLTEAKFEALHADFGRPSIAPERLIRASLIQILVSVRSDRQLTEQMPYNLMFRWFEDLGIGDPVWVPTVFSKNRSRLLTTVMSRKVMAAICAWWRRMSARC